MIAMFGWLGVILAFCVREVSSGMMWLGLLVVGIFPGSVVLMKMLDWYRTFCIFPKTRLVDAIEVYIYLSPLRVRGKVTIGAICCISWLISAPQIEMAGSGKVILTGVIVSVTMGYLLFSLQPVGILYLTASSETSASLFKDLRMSSHGLRVAALLRPQLMNIEERFFQHDNYRTNDEADWRRSVSRLMDIASIVLIDSSEITPFVQEEIAIATTHHRRKTLVLFAAKPSNVEQFEPGVKAEWPLFQLNRKLAVDAVHKLTLASTYPRNLPVEARLEDIVRFLN